ncbi:adenosylcobinamide-GDP ribazoletransferase [Methylocystis sp. L43]|uniref:adenosylcobinamide-GDP ribazoletransferase n=1 Tax=unclassified Methylocystis TaxID=2625913 RepID=UPI0018C1F107|nr:MULTISPECIES: adenosylcobinamide-GDP ribazoletransferase [unclassified Methylocystis]MBG0797532.1 adenosylcobinamide-GDP ribazoletransferase [Methylocystis sp. L43]MBG0805137.1 adenosylcobinamide-GDP ribazoletransferase [Methylocystis sp. H15]
MQRPLLADVATFLRFYSRLPIGDDAQARLDFARMAPALPIAGAVIGATGAAGLLVARICHFPALVCALVAVAVLVLATGALHEDGLADVADGFGGGATRESKLAIMRDSRVGTYGALALCFSILLRVAALASIAERSVALAALALVFVAALSRVAGLAPMMWLPPARAEGLGAGVSAPSREVWARAGFAAAAFGLGPWLAGAGASQIAVAIIAAFGAAALIANLAKRQIGGYTGDVLGAAQQLAEIAALAALSAN